MLEEKIKQAKQKAEDVLNKYMKIKKYSSKNSSKFGMWDISHFNFRIDNLPKETNNFFIFIILNLALYLEKQSKKLSLTKLKFAFIN